MPNRRLSGRILFRKKVNYGLCNYAFAGYTFNLSEDGIGIRTHRVFPPRSKILIQIHLGGSDLEESRMDEIIRVEGTVAWVSPVLPGIFTTMGIRFLRQSDGIKQIYLQRIIGRF